jgi:hypothetical protein
MQTIGVDDATNRIRLDYVEMPGLRLTFWQAQRLWNLPDGVCERALERLTLSGFLVRTRDGSYLRRHTERRGDDATHRQGAHHRTT